MTTCDKCGGREVIERDGKLYECICSFLVRISASMPPYIRKAEVLPPHLELPIMKAVRKSVYVVSTWADMKAVVKAVMIMNPSKFVRVSSDAEIRDVFVGSKSKAAKSSDFEGEVYNNLSDLMDPPDLMVIRLNEISYKNKAAAGALEEALSYRLDRDKPTWVLSNVDRRFVSGSFAYSESVAELLGTGYVRMAIPEIAPRASVDGGLFADPVSPAHGTGVPASAQLEDPDAGVPREGRGKAAGRPKRARPAPGGPDDLGDAPGGSLSHYGQGLQGQSKGRSSGGFGRGGR
jgi:hypothetical protein